jgi:hypothetical protein
MCRAVFLLCSHTSIVEEQHKQKYGHRGMGRGTSIVEEQEKEQAEAED